MTAETGLHEAQWILLVLLVFVTAFAALARKLQTPYPIVLVMAGLLLGFIPGAHRVTLNPDLILFVVLPPLLYAAAWDTSWRELSRDLVSILMLAFGLVGFTALGVAWVGPLLFSGFDWRAGLVLGAAVAPTDSIAAASIARRIGLPKRIANLLEGESLMHDATGLLALELATAMVVDGHTPSAGAGLLRLIYLIGAGCAIGLVLGRAAEWVERRLDDGPIEIAFSLLIPYAAYLAAEAVHGSGVLAVVAAGLYLAPRSSEFFSPGVRLQAQAVWRALEFILNGFVFVLIGIQLPFVLAGVSELSVRQVILYGAVLSLLLILLRVAWTFPGVYVAGLIRRHVLRQNEAWPGARQVFVIGWTGMRGVLALVAAMSLPDTVADGSPFPHRDLIVFLTFSVILVTLVLQGLTLPPLIRALGLAGFGGSKGEDEKARRLTLQAAMARLDEIRREDSSLPASLYDDVALHYQRRLESGDEHYFQYVDLSRELLKTEREAALRLRDAGAISDEALREMEHELDLNETRLIAVAGRREVETR
jgi:monovalent cation/hydrogen antiporter